MPIMSDHYRIYPIITEHIRLLPNISEHYRTYPNITEHLRSLPITAEYQRIRLCCMSVSACCVASLSIFLRVYSSRMFISVFDSVSLVYVRTGWMQFSAIPHNCLDISCTSCLISLDQKMFFRQTGFFRSRCEASMFVNTMCTWISKG